MHYAQNKRVFRYEVLHHNVLSYQDVSAINFLHAENMMKQLATDRNYTSYTFMHVLDIVPTVKRATK